MAYQGFTTKNGEVDILAEITGQVILQKLTLNLLNYKI